MINQFVIISKIGEGSHSKVCLVAKCTKNKTSVGPKFALKIIKHRILKRQKNFIKDSTGSKLSQKGTIIIDATEHLKKEIAIMKKLHHENIIRLHEVINAVKDEKTYLVMEFAENGQLIIWDSETCTFSTKENSTSKFPEEKLKSIFRDCIKGLTYRFRFHY